MGQYYRPVLKVNDTIHIFNRDIDGEYTMAKLTEHSWWPNPMVNAVVSRLYKTKGKLAWVGDYTEDEELPEDLVVSDVWETKGEGLTSVDFTLDNKFIVNWDRKEYISANDYKEDSNSEGWVLHPLPLLTAIGNGRGGGDYKGRNFGYCGFWTWDTISIEDTIPQGFVEMKITFKED
jgi:hypothetical protein